MNFVIRSADNPSAWNQFVSTTNPFCFTQSWEWGEILRAEGKPISRWVIEQDGVIVALGNSVEQSLPFGWCSVLSPQGPIFSAELSTKQIQDIYGVLFNEKKLVFARVEPGDQKQVVKKMVRTKDLNPSTTTVLDLNLSEADLLAAMHQKTRYNIHLAEKKGIEIREEKNEELFWKLTQATADRDGFRSHERSHYRHVLASPISRQLIAYYDNQAITTAVFVYFGGVCTYLYGASDYRARQLKAPGLVQWQGICMGKKAGCTRYDFFGIAPKRKGDSSSEYHFDPRHSYAGITQFKLGFGGSVVVHPGTWDLILQPQKYRVYQLLRRVKNLVRL